MAQLEVRGENATSKERCLFGNSDILEIILNHLDSPRDRRAASQVCKKWYVVDGRTRKSVYISNCYSVAPSKLTKRFKNLEKIRIKGKPRAFEFALLVDNWGGHAGPWIQEITRAYESKLQSLNLCRMEITDGDLELLASKCVNLQKLKLLKCSGFTTEGLQFITDSCRSLRVLDLEESDGLLDKGESWLELLKENKGTLEKIRIASPALVRNIKDPLVAVAQRLKSISSLKVSDMELESFEKILNHSTVPVVELGLGCYSSMVPENPIRLAAQLSPWLPKLKILDLKFATLGADSQIEILRHCPCLEELELRSLVGDRGMQVIGDTCKQLRRIRVDQDHLVNMTDYVTQTGVIAVCEGCRELEFLVMYVSDITNEALAAVGRCLPKLTDFRIVLLEVLDIVQDLPLDDGVRSLLQGCSMLTRFSVYLRLGGLSDRGMGYIGELGEKLKWVLLGCSGESDEGMRRLADGCLQLERLELRDCPFGEAQLAQSLCTSLKSLKYFWVQGIGATLQLGQVLVLHKPGFFVEFMGDTKQLMGYYSVASPRTDNPETVCLISPDPHVSLYMEYEDTGFYPELEDHGVYLKVEENGEYSGYEFRGDYIDVGSNGVHPDLGDNGAYIY